jgi:hypothetical protein
MVALENENIVSQPRIMQGVLVGGGPCSLIAVIGPLVAGCGDGGGHASPETGARKSTAASEAPEAYRDAEKIVERRVALRQRVQESFDEPRMFAAVREQYDIQEGYQPTAAYDVRTMAHYDQATGRWTWQAFQCRNPACRAQTGKPLLFAYEIPGVTLGDDGKPVFPPEAAMEGATCPRCHQKNVHVHTLPEAAARRAELEAEVAASRADRQRAREQGTAASGGHRPSQAIFDEMAALPKLYLLPEE